MEIRELAERVLFGTRWEDKLHQPDRCDDRTPGTGITAPSAPGRPPDLALDRWDERDKVHFADVRGLHTEKERGLVLHFFANHELLALELMALVLLRFPHAPERFRRGVLQTLHDEQDHLRLYVDRMDQIGVHFGEIPVSDYFWKAISPMETPVDFVTSLSLTLEQANLDYAVHYEKIFHRLNDVETASILKRVYADEIRHVRHGLNWFNRWRDTDESEWASYARHLIQPLTPNRAKGIGFNREGRRQAGFTDQFISELNLYSRSRGRCPAVYWFNPACEAEIAAGTSFQPSRLVQALADDLAALPMFLCAPDDVVVVPKRPSSDFLTHLQKAGFNIPEFVATGDRPLSETELADRHLGSLRPWGQSPQSARTFAPLAEKLPEASANLWDPLMRPGFSKEWSARLLREFLEEEADDEWLCEPAVVGVECRTVEQVLERVFQLTEQGYREIVAKASLGSSGQNQVRFSNNSTRSEQLAWMERLLQSGALVVEPWLEKVVDLSLSLDCTGSGEWRQLGWTRFLTDGRGQYIGTFVHGNVAGLDVTTRKFLYGELRKSRRLQHLLDKISARIVSALSRLDLFKPTGFVGPVGIDMLVFRGRDGLRFKPIVEVNPRFTMGHVALNFRRRVNAARAALWLILPTGAMKEAGLTGAEEFTAHMAAAYPLTFTGDGLISQGVLPTTDPQQAEGFLTLLVVGENLDACKACFIDLPGKIADWTGYC